MSRFPLHRRSAQADPPDCATPPGQRAGQIPAGLLAGLVGVAEQGCTDEIDTSGDRKFRSGDRIDVGHHEQAEIVVELADDIRDGFAVRTRARGGIDRDDVRSGTGDRCGVVVSRRDVGCKITDLLFPEANQRNIRQAIAHGTHAIGAFDSYTHSAALDGGGGDRGDHVRRIEW